MRSSDKNETRQKSAGGDKAQISCAKWWCHVTTTDCTSAEWRPREVTGPSSRPPLLINPLDSPSCRLCSNTSRKNKTLIFFDFLCEPFYFPFKVFTGVGSLQKPIAQLCGVYVCSAPLHPAQFSVPAAHSTFWCVCAFFVGRVQSPVLSCCSCLISLGLAWLGTCTCTFENRQHSCHLMAFKKNNNLALTIYL